MGKLSTKAFYYIIATWVVVFCLHNLQYFIAYQMEKEDDTIFTPFSYKAPFGLSEDNLAYAEVIRYASNNPSLFTPDGIIKENEGKKFPGGNLVVLYLGMVHNLLGDMDLTYYFGGLLPLLISVILIFKLIKLFFHKHVIPISICVSILILCTNFNDFMGIEKFLKAFFFPENYQHHGNVLVLGYAQRFACCQSSIFLFLFWVYQLIIYLKNCSLKNQLLLVLSLGLLQYSYFYYWSFAIPMTFALVAISKKSIKEILPLIIGTVTIILPYWLKVYEFNQTPFYAEYQEKMGGVQTYGAIYGIILIGTLNLIPFFNQGKKWFNIGLLIAPVVLSLVIEFLNHTFQPYHPIFYSTKITVLPAFITLGLLARFWNKWDSKAMLCLTNYYLILLLCSLKFILGFNLQPYHWVYATFYPLLVLTMIIAWQPIIKGNILKNGLIIAASTTIILGIFNSYKTADHNHDFWTIKQDDQEVINFLSKSSYPVIAGNNLMPIITFSAHTDIYIYEGMTCNSFALYNELAQRFIHPYKLMGYSDSNILKEFNQYKELGDYHHTFTKGTENQRDSLSYTFPDNLLGSIESMFHYFTSPKKYEAKFKQSLAMFTAPNFELDFLVIYKPTFRGNYSSIEADKVFENNTYMVYDM